LPSRESSKAKTSIANSFWEPRDRPIDSLAALRAIMKLFSRAAAAKVRSGGRVWCREGRRATSTLERPRPQPPQPPPPKGSKPDLQQQHSAGSSGSPSTAAAAAAARPPQQQQQREEEHEAPDLVLEHLLRASRGRHVRAHFFANPREQYASVKDVRVLVRDFFCVCARQMRRCEFARASAASDGEPSSSTKRSSSSFAPPPKKTTRDE
jgi:hypothetical protein